MNRNVCFGCMRDLFNMEICPCCGFDPKKYKVEAHQLPLGTVLHDRFTVGRVLGEGGFGITYVGMDTVLDIKVAVKEFYIPSYVNRNNTHSTTVFVNPGASGEDFDRKRQKFLNEARVLAKFAAEDGIVGIRDFFEENNTAYIVMDFLSGETLRAYIDREGTLPVNRTLELLLPLIKSLGNIHKQNVIHRDISPDNIMITDGGMVKLLDFGAAKEVSSGDIKSRSVILKPGYAPEEQYRSKGVLGPWTDIYALCATIYRCITGVVPDESMNRLFEDTLVPPSKLGLGCSAEMSSVIMKGLAIRHTDRFKSIDELIAAIELADKIPEAVLSDKKDPTASDTGAVLADRDRTLYAGEEESVQIEDKTLFVGNESAGGDGGDKTVFVGNAELTESVDSDRTLFAEPERTRSLPVTGAKQKPGKKKEKKKAENKGRGKTAAIIILAVLLFIVCLFAAFLLGASGWGLPQIKEWITPETTSQHDLQNQTGTSTEFRTDSSAKTEPKTTPMSSSKTTEQTPPVSDEQTTEESEDQVTETSPPETTSIPEETEYIPDPVRLIETGSIPYPFNDYSFTVDGWKITIPARFSEFEAEGWTLSPRSSDYEEPDYDELVPVCEFGNLYLKKDGYEIDAYYVNASSETQALRDCYVYEIVCGDKGVELPLGLVLDETSTNTVINTLPYGYIKDPERDHYKYYNNAYGSPYYTSSYFVICYGGLTTVRISNLGAVLLESEISPYDLTPPEYNYEHLELYLEGEMFTVESEDSTIQIPDTVASLIEQGCTFSCIPEYKENGYVVETAYLTLPAEFGNVTYKVGITNPFDRCTATELCFVSEVYISEDITPIYTVVHEGEEPFDVIFGETSFSEVLGHTKENHTFGWGDYNSYETGFGGADFTYYYDTVYIDDVLTNVVDQVLIDFSSTVKSFVKGYLDYSFE